jgi:hypothetical protein
VRSSAQRPGCPALEDVLLATEGHLRTAEHAIVVAHVRDCAACQQLVHDLDDLALASVGGGVSMLDDDAAVFNEPRERARFAERLHRQEQALGHRRTGMAVARWVSVAAVLALPLLVIGFLFSRSHVAIVQADELVRRAVLAQGRSSTPPQTVRFDWWPPNAPASHSFNVVQPLADLAAVERTQARAARELPASVREALAVFEFDWRRPLSLDGVLRWRASHLDRHDEVVPLPDPRFLLVRMTTIDGAPRVLELTLERETYRVVRHVLVFADNGRVEIELVPTPIDSVREAAAPPAIAPSVVSRDELDRVELDARVLLGQAGLDVRGDVRVSHSAAGVRIAGSVPSGTAYRTTRARVAALPHVQVSLVVRDPADGGVTRDAGRSASGLPALMQRLDDAASGPTLTGDAFGPTLTRAAGQVRRRLDVLQELAERYSAAEVEPLSTDARVTLNRLLDLQYDALGDDLRELNAQMTTFGAAPKAGSETLHAPPDWRFRATAARSHAISLERLMQAFVSREDAPAAQRQVLATFGALWDTLNGAAMNQAATR